MHMRYGVDRWPNLYSCMTNNLLQYPKTNSWTILNTSAANKIEQGNANLGKTSNRRGVRSVTLAYAICIIIIIIF